jgi:hypothetical protein
MAVFCRSDQQPSGSPETVLPSLVAVEIYQPIHSFFETPDAKRFDDAAQCL